MDETGTVVVGVDGSPGSRGALEYAMEDAARRHARLRVVAAVRPPDYWATAYGMAAPPPLTDIVEDVRTAATQEVAGVSAARPDLAGLSITVEARAGIPAEVIAEAAEDADLLVLGHRGRGAVASALLGSVGLHCVLHAICPVTIVRSVPATIAADAVPADAVPV